MRQIIVVANTRATACSNLLNMQSAQRYLTSYRSKQHRDTGELLALAIPPDDLTSVPQSTRQTSPGLPSPMFASSMFTGPSPSPNVERPLASLELISATSRICLPALPFCPLRSGYIPPRIHLLSLPIMFIVQPAAASSLPHAQRWPSQTRLAVRVRSAAGTCTRTHGP